MLSFYFFFVRSIDLHIWFRFQQIDEKVENREIDLNAVERSEVLTHPTASRVKAPKRRPPSGINFKEVRILCSQHRLRLIWNFLFLNLANTRLHDPIKKLYFFQEEIGLFNGKGSPSKVMINGTADLPNDKMKAAPWLQELKMSQVKKSSSQGKILILITINVSLWYIGRCLCVGYLRVCSIRSPKSVT